MQTISILFRSSLLSALCIVIGCSGDDDVGSSATEGTTEAATTTSESGTSTTTTTGDTTTTTGDTTTGGGFCAPEDGDDACASCTKENCCDEAEACAADEGCVCWLECLQGGGDQAQCFGSCGQNAAFFALGACVQGSCGMVCG